MVIFPFGYNEQITNKYLIYIQKNYIIIGYFI